MSSPSATPFGFTYDPAAFPAAPEPQNPEIALAYFQRAMPEFVWDAAALEGNPFTFPEVQTLMEGTTVGGHKVTDETEVQNIITASRLVSELVRGGGFALSPEVSNLVAAAIGRDLVLDAGMFRGTGAVGGTPTVRTGGDPYYPPATEDGGENLFALHGRIVEGLEEVAPGDPWRQALLYNLAGCFAQFYFDGNKRTSRLMMNGHLMAHGIEPISIPAASRQEYNQVMSQAYVTGDASAAIAFVGHCHERLVRARLGHPPPPSLRR